MRELPHVLGIVLAGGEGKRQLRGAPGYFDRLKRVHEVSAVTAACVATRRSVYEALGGFNSRDLVVGFNDVDYCVRVKLAGYRIIWTPHAELYHYESISRGRPSATAEGAARAEAEHAYMRRQWGAILDADPYYNPNFLLDVPTFRLAEESRTRKPWHDFAAARFRRQLGRPVDRETRGLAWFGTVGPEE